MIQVYERNDYTRLVGWRFFYNVLHPLCDCNFKKYIYAFWGWVCWFKWPIINSLCGWRWSKIPRFCHSSPLMFETQVQLKLTTEFQEQYLCLYYCSTQIFIQELKLFHCSLHVNYIKHVLMSLHNTNVLWEICKRKFKLCSKCKSLGTIATFKCCVLHSVQYLTAAASHSLYCSKIDMLMPKRVGLH